MKQLITEISKLNIDFKEGVLGSKLTTASVGGIIQLLVLPNDTLQLSQVLKLIFNSGMSYKILGNGSNLLIPDDGIIDEPVIQLGKGFKSIHKEKDVISVGGNVYLPRLSRTLSSDGIVGFEFAGGIPASVGGAIRMNAGAHGAEISSVVRKITVVRNTGQIEELNVSDIEWSYRKNSLPPDAVVCAVDFNLNYEDPKIIEEKFKANLEDRKKHQPLQFPSFGSVFKNPEGQRGSAGKLIEEAGLKGFQIGNAEVSSMHANWIVNPKKTAKTSDILQLIETCRKKVFEQFGITLEPEVIRW